MDRQRRMGKINDYKIIIIIFPSYTQCCKTSGEVKVFVMSSAPYDMQQYSNMATLQNNCKKTIEPIK